MPRALVTGATGLVGSHIVELLLREGWSVRGLARSDASRDALRAAGVEAVNGDLLDNTSLGAASSGADVIFHTAAAITQRGGWEGYRRLNVDGTNAMITAAERSGARLLHLSSVAVYGSMARYNAAGAKTTEDAPLGPLRERSYYARSKRESETMVMDAHRAGRIWATAVRPSVIYGPRDRQFVPRMANALKFGVMPLIGGGRSTLAVVHAANVASGAVLAATSEAAGGRAYNLANDFDVTVRDFSGSPAKDSNGAFVSSRFRSGRRESDCADSRSSIASRSAESLPSRQEGSLSFLSRDNPFSSDRARRELGWSPALTHEVGVPAAFRWWMSEEKKRGRE